MQAKDTEAHKNNNEHLQKSPSSTHLLYVEHDDDLDDNDEWNQWAEEEAGPQQRLVVDEVHSVAANVELPQVTEIINTFVSFIIDVHTISLSIK